MLELAIARTLYDRYPDASEGRLAKIRAHVVSRASCAAVSRELGLGGLLIADEVIDIFLPVLYFAVKKWQWRKIHHAGLFDANGRVTSGAQAAPLPVAD